MSKEVEEMIKIYEELLNNENTEYLINYLIRNYKNGIIFCGVGKNWYIAEKLCKTALSMGIPAQALDPTHAMHGDIGMINNQTIIFTSKSGETNELSVLIKYLKKIRALGIINPKFASVFLNKNASLNSEMDSHLSIYPLSDVKEIKEFDIKGLVPSLSINIVQMFLDKILSKIFDANEKLRIRYKYNHPYGSIGKELGMSDMFSENINNK